MTDQDATTWAHVPALIAASRRDIADADRCEALEIAPAVHQLHRRLREVTSALAAEHARAERAWDDGRMAVIKLASEHSAHDHPFDGYIDQHVIAIGGSKLRNPYTATAERDGEAMTPERMVGADRTAWLEERGRSISPTTTPNQPHEEHR